ncbi:retinol dehydrogenase [Aliifodinibius salipaludis]|uniref:Retinol dehydrogenase n=1 Tax=Fodinibius salipaludis TaxID=2032627 RepID=A0A2A2GBY8_9BACT|nr:SDR family oxidoreductase [Aliifodinibius salipaludis]PAU94383.1 retinol dehydrogenase [Aliifodinibius salipaludis]
MDLTNKLCIVTGANSGIGKETARSFAADGAYVVMICRNEKRAQAARQDIIEDTGNTGIKIILADLGIQQDVRSAADQVNREFYQIDVLVNNAGLIANEHEETIDGIEKTLAVNHLAPFLLTNLLWDGLQQSNDARIINVSSEIHKMGAKVFDLDNLQLTENYSSMKAYGVSKLCNIMFTHELAKRTENSPITTYSLHPGVVGTQLAEEASWAMKLFYWLGKPFMRSPKSGAATTIYLATANDVKSMNGQYFKDQKVTEPAGIAYNDKLTSKLWKKSEELTGLS